jgi:hypothetical protein
MTTIGRLMGAGVPATQAQQTVAGKPVSGLTAAGSTQGTALAIVNDFSVFTTVAAGTGGILPAQNGASMTALAGDIYIAVNGGANALLVYPPVGGNFITVAVNTAVSVPAGKTADFYCLGNNVWAASIGG